MPPLLLTPVFHNHSPSPCPAPPPPPAPPSLPAALAVAAAVLAVTRGFALPMIQSDQQLQYPGYPGAGWSTRVVAAVVDAIVMTSTSVVANGLSFIAAAVLLSGQSSVLESSLHTRELEARKQREDQTCREEGSELRRSKAQRRNNCNGSPSTITLQLDCSPGSPLLQPQEQKRCLKNAYCSSAADSSRLNRAAAGQTVAGCERGREQ